MPEFNPRARTMLIAGGTVIDAVADRPLFSHDVLIQGSRIVAIAPANQLETEGDTTVINAAGKFLIPGLMNANVHLFGLHALEGYARHWGHYDDLILESAQVALRSGITTVFDTWGPRRHLINVRDQIASGHGIGSRIFCAGNIIGFDGPFSADFFPKAADVASTSFVRKVNAIWVENVGRHLMWLTPEEVAIEVGKYIKGGIDFIKYASNEHYPGAFIAFSPHSQRAIVEEAHRAGLTAQAHSMSVEGLRLAIEAGCDLVTHCNITGSTRIPTETLDAMVTRGTGAVVFPFTERRFQLIMRTVSETERTIWRASDTNVRNMIKAGARLMLANDGSVVTSEWAEDPQFGNSWITVPDEDNLCQLATGHFAWFKAMEEKECPPLEMLRAATKNIAVAYGLEGDLGTLEAGKRADIIILDKNPLEAAENYRSIHFVIKDGMLVDREGLPQKRIMTKQEEAPFPEESSYIPFCASSAFPACPMCIPRRDR